MTTEIIDDRELDQTDIDLLNQIRVIEQAVNGLLEHLDTSKTPDPDDDPEAEYVPGMNVGDGYLYPGLDRRWLAIGTTQLQQGFMAIERAVTRKEGL